ncbi:AraC family transcriptional activator of pobA [Rhizobium borbori]|uniref:AraC family transcriptional activator of pobA n=2 Tax=Allorhizobium borbori TaxID=485907 RepID=A0A7W6K515_9HYPH|nr:AraC family transcriptional activator of pobA [Allorhizobium borbori]
MQIFFVEQGAARIRVDGVSSRLEDGDFQFIPAQSVHDLEIVRGSEGLVLSFPVALVAALHNTGLERRLARSFVAQADARVRLVLRQIATTFAGTDTYRDSLLVGLAQTALAASAEIAARSAEAMEPLQERRMLEFDRLLVEHLAAGWGAAEFALAMSITPGHLSRICRGATGQSASRHIEAARMTEAGRLLAFTRLSVAEIGYRLGYADPPYFSRRFREATGETPSQYRSRYSG